MKKATLLSLVTLSGLVLTQAHIYADETTPADPTVATEVVSPVETTETEIVAPIDTNTTPESTVTLAEPEVTEPAPTESVNPEVPVDTTESEESMTSPTDPSTAPTTEGETTETTEPTTEAPSSERNNSEEKTSEDKTKPQTAIEATNQGKSQVGTTSTVTGQVVVNPASKPVTTQTGFQIIGTQNSQVIVAQADGTTALVAAEVVGGTVNSDKTISVKDSDGKMTTLPETGEEENALISLSGVGILASLYAFLLRKKTVKSH